MFNLVLKDILLQKKEVKDIVLSVLLTFLYMCILQFFGAECVYISSPFICTISFILYSCGFGEKNDVDVMINSLPVSRKEIVFSKYLSALVFFIIGLVITAVFSTIVKVSGFSHINRLINLQDVIISYVIVTVYSSIYLPIYLLVGYLKSQSINHVLTLGTLIFLICIILLVTFVDNGTAAKWIMDFVSVAHFKLKMYAVCIFSSIILTFISILISLKVYINRDF